MPVSTVTNGEYYALLPDYIIWRVSECVSEAARLKPEPESTLSAFAEYLETCLATSAPGCMNIELERHLADQGFRSTLNKLLTRLEKALGSRQFATTPSPATMVRLLRRLANNPESMCVYSTLWNEIRSIQLQNVELLIVVAYVTSPERDSSQAENRVVRSFRELRHLAKKRWRWAVCDVVGDLGSELARVLSEEPVKAEFVARLEGIRDELTSMRTKRHAYLPPQWTSRQERNFMHKPAYEGNIESMLDLIGSLSSFLREAPLIDGSVSGRMGRE